MQKKKNVYTLIKFESYLKRNIGYFQCLYGEMNKKNKCVHFSIATACAI